SVFAYVTIFHYAIRFSLASLAAYAISELLDLPIFAIIRDKMNGQSLWLRNNVTNFIAQFMDSFIFIFLAFYMTGLSFHANFTFLFSLIIPYWLIRCSLSIIETPLVYLGVWWLRGSKEIPKNLAIIPKVAEQ